MKILLDQNLTRRLRSRLRGHLVVWAGSLSWGELENGDLIALAESNGYEVLVTADQGIFYQQNNEIRAISLVVLSTNDWYWLQRKVEAIESAILRAQPGSFEFVRIAVGAKGERT